VSLTERLFGRGGVKLDLAAVQARIAEAVRASVSPDADLTRARLADRCRDVNLTPVLPEEFDRAAAALDAEGWRRLAVLVAALDLEPVRAALVPLANTWPMHQVVSAAFTGLAQDTPLLTLEVLSQSAQRVEELTRRFLAALRAGIAGETSEISKRRLDLLDYGKLLAEAEKAREAAADRAERLRKLQEEQESRRSRRGKM
jgi:hypothetical protein